VKRTRLSPLLALLLVSGLAHGQQAPGEPAGPPATAPAGPLTPPPLVGAPDEDVPPPPEIPTAVEPDGPRRPSVTEAALPRKQEPAKDPVPRVAVEVLGGTAGGVVGATVLGSFGYLLGSATVGCNECLVMAVAGAAAGGLIGIPVGTYAGGHFMGGSGRLGATVAGSMVGWGATFLALSLVNSGSSEPNPAVNAALFILPVVGASAGFELSHHNALNREAEEREARPPTLRLMPVAGYSAHGPQLGLLGSF
jgi:hypothetical protein